MQVLAFGSSGEAQTRDILIAIRNLTVVIIETVIWWAINTSGTLIVLTFYKHNRKSLQASRLYNGANHNSRGVCL